MYYCYSDSDLYGPPVLRPVDAEELVDLGEHLGAEGEGAGEGATAQLTVPVLLADRAVPAIHFIFRDV